MRTALRHLPTRRRTVVGMRRVLAIVAVALSGIAVISCGSSSPALRTMTHAHHGPVTPAPPPPPLRDGERFVNVTMPRPYTPAPPNGGTDEYRCFLVDPQLTERAFVTGSQFLPQNAAIVHHAIFFRVEPGDAAAAHTLDANTPGDGWTCFGGTGIGGGGVAGQLRAGGAWIGAWAPGGTETLLDARTGYQLEPGSQIVMQVHYSLLATGGKPAGGDRSGIRLRLADGTADLDPLRTTLVPGPVELPCAAGESGELCDRERSIVDVSRRFGPQAGLAVAGLNLLCNRGQTPVAGPTQHCDMRVREAGTVHALAGHMHLLGRSITVELNPGTPGAQTLLNVPAYNFDDQGARALATPVAVKPGDTFRVTCTHDATLRSQLPELRPLPPRYVVWGDGTSDEMCLGIVVWSQRS
jgi:hypothetical protein